MSLSRLLVPLAVCTCWLPTLKRYKEIRANEAFGRLVFGSGESLFVKWKSPGIDQGGPGHVGHLTHPDANVFARRTHFHVTPASKSAISTQQDGRASASGLHLAGGSCGNAGFQAHSSKQTHPVPADSHRCVVRMAGEQKA